MSSSTRDRLVQMVTAEPSKYHEAELGRMLGVRRQRVHAIAVVEEVHHLIKCQRRCICTRCGRHTTARLCWSCWLKELDSRKVTCACDECGRVFTRLRYRVKRYKHHFCSQSCKGKYLGRHYGLHARGERREGFCQGQLGQQKRIIIARNAGDSLTALFC